MKKVIVLLLILLSLRMSKSQTVQPVRPDIYDFSPAERTTLRNDILEWTVHHIVNHVDCLCHGNNTFYGWHSNRIETLEEFLLTDKNHPQFVPLPKWSPADCVPDEFMGEDGVVNNDYDPIITQCLNEDVSEWDRIYFSENNDVQNFCQGNSGMNGCPSNPPDNFSRFRNCFEIFHNGVHDDLGGSMTNPDFSPGVALFWIWHGWIDDVFEQYFCICDDEDDDYFGANDEWDYFDGTIDNINSQDEYRAFRHLETEENEDVIIEDDRDILFKAGTQVLLLPGFSTELGGVFTAFIDECPRYGDQIVSRLNLLDDKFAGTYVNEDSQKYIPTNYALRISPNPANDLITLNSPKAISSITFYDLLGSKLLEEQNTQNNSFNVSSLSQGVYLLKVFFTDQTVETARIVIQR